MWRIPRWAGLARLERLMAKLTLINPPRDLKLPEGVQLDSKDGPILLVAIHGKADFLLTGDSPTSDISTASASRA